LLWEESLSPETPAGKTSQENRWTSPLPAEYSKMLPDLELKQEPENEKRRHEPERGKKNETRSRSPTATGQDRMKKQQLFHKITRICFKPNP
jgi:hypothetical protein